LQTAQIVQFDDGERTSLLWRLRRMTPKGDRNRQDASDDA
jgi:hypothetical protein